MTVHRKTEMRRAPHDLLWPKKYTKIEILVVNVGSRRRRPTTKMHRKFHRKAPRSTWIRNSRAMLLCGGCLMMMMKKKQRMCRFCLCRAELETLNRCGCRRRIVSYFHFIHFLLRPNLIGWTKRRTRKSQRMGCSSLDQKRTDRCDLLQTISHSLTLWFGVLL